MGEKFLRVNDLHVHFPTDDGLVKAVDGLSFDLEKGTTLGIVGESGSGKSVTSLAVMGLHRHSRARVSGEIWLDDQNLLEVSDEEIRSLRGQKMAMIFQDPLSAMHPYYTVGRQLTEAITVHHKVSKAEARRSAVDMLGRVGIPNPNRRFDQYPHEFSGGMRQRVLIAMGLACRPRLLIADEPTSALDVTVQRRVLDQLDELTDAMGAAVFLITHDLALAAERADRIVVMYKGRIVEEGRSADLLRDPQHEYTRRLIAAAPSLTSRRVPLPDRAAGAGVAGDGGTGALVEVRDLRKVFPMRAAGKDEAKTFTAVDGISFTIPRGRTVSIVGESGSGKSTTANLVLGLESITDGTILFDGQDISGFGRKELLGLRRRVQPVFQNPYASLDPRYTVERSIAEPLKVHGIGDAASRGRRVGELLEQVALPREFAGRLPHQLSGGQCQRVAIARALALEPDLVVLDEAVSALDVLVQAQVLQLLAELQQRLGLSYLFISHDLAVVRMISDEVHVMQRGRIVESGTPEQIFEAPQHDYTRELLAAIPGAGLDEAS